MRLADLLSGSVEPEAPGRFGLSGLAERLANESPWKHKPPTPEEFINSEYWIGPLAQDFDALPVAIRKEWCKSAATGMTEVILSGCVTGDTLLQMEDGGLIPVGAMDTAASILTRHGPAMTPGVVCNGRRSVMRLDLADGRRLTATPDHPVLVWKDWEYVWTPLCSLREGDLVVGPRKVETRPSSDLSEAGARVLGYMLTDGHACHGHATYTDGCEGSHKDFVAALAELGFPAKTVRCNNKAAWETRPIRYRRSGFREWLVQHGYPVEGGSKDVFVAVPAQVCRAPSNVVAAFLRAVWSAEGCVYTGGKSTSLNSTSPFRLTLGMTSERFIRQVQMLLLRFGIHARIRFVQHLDKRHLTEHCIWHLVVSGAKDVSTFFREVGLVPGKEEKCNKIIEMMNGRTPNTNVDLLPITHYDFYNFVNAQGGNACKTKVSAVSARLSFARANAYREVVGDTIVDALFEKIPEDLSFIPVKKIEEAGEAFVFDLSVPEYEEFYGNGLAIHNSIGCFKTQRAVLLMEYLAALHQCLHDPGSYYGLGAGAEMDIAFVSVNRQAAKDVGFDRLASFIAQSPFFQEHARPDPKYSSELRFRGLTIKPAVSNERGIISRALLGLVMDEAAFMDVSQKSRRARGAETTYDAAFNIYSQALVRMKSRFVRDGQPVPYKIVIASSAQFPDDFVSRRRMQVEAERLMDVHVSDMSLWEAKPDAFSKHTFRVEVGDELHFPRILKDGEDPRPGSRVVCPPMDFLPDFERDIDRAIRDIAGLPLQTLAPLISERRKVTDCIRTVEKGYTPEQCEHPFTHEVTSLVDGCKLLSDLICERGKDGLLYPRTNPQTVRFIHLDPSFGRQDPFGFAMVHATGFSEGTWRNPRTGQVEEKYAVQVYVDAMLRIIKPSNGGDISIGDIETLLRQCQEHGYEIGLVTSDNQGAFLLNRLSQLGYETEILSVDRTTDPYLNLRSAFNEGRISMYHYEPVIEELFHLEWNKQRNKVDHGHRFGKDISDALAGAVFMATTRGPEYDTGGRKVAVSVY